MTGASPGCNDDARRTIVPDEHKPRVVLNKWVAPPRLSGTSAHKQSVRRCAPPALCNPQSLDDPMEHQTREHHPSKSRKQR